LARDTRSEIEKFTQELNAWREERSGGDGRIPALLWRKVGRLAAAHGIGAIARATGLNHGRIRSRMQVKMTSRGRSAPSEKGVVPGRGSALVKSPFVEVPLSFASHAESALVVEVRSGRGEWIRIENGNAAGTPRITVKIRTTWAPGANPDVLSGYGRGTTADDIAHTAQGHNTVRFHESMHRADMKAYVAHNAMPDLELAVGMSRAEAQTAVENWGVAVEEYGKKMSYDSYLKTDCVGSPKGGCP